VSSHGDSFAASGSSPTRPASQTTHDFLVENQFSILLLRPLTPAARSWLEENIGSKNGLQPYWPTVVIEPRYIKDVLMGIPAAGLTVQS